jgi:hypothetical protein
VSYDIRIYFLRNLEKRYFFAGKRGCQYGTPKR